MPNTEMLTLDINRILIGPLRILIKHDDSRLKGLEGDIQTDRENIPTVSKMGYQTILLLVGIIFAVSLNQAGSIGIRRNAECTNLKTELDKLAPENGPKSRNATDSMKMDEPIVLWQGVLLIICFGAFASFIALIYWVIRLYVYEDTQLLDTFFDAGADVSAPLVATSIVTKYTWVSTFVVSSWAVTKWGIVGSFWYSVASVVPVFVFSMVAAELKIKSPGAKTYLQIIKARFGSATHAIFLTTSFLFHLFVCALIMKGGLDMITYMVDGLSFEIASIIVGIVVAIYTLIGGLGGTFYVAYFSSAFTYVCILVMFIEVFYNLLDFDTGLLLFNGDPVEHGSISASLIYKLANCATGTDATEANEDDHFLTFFSKGSLLWAVIHTFASFAVVFVDNSTWQSAVAAKPQRSVYGFLTGGLCWFVIPWSFSVMIGSMFLALTIQSGMPIASEVEIEKGLLPIIVLNQILSPAGEFVFLMLVVVALCTSAASEVLSASAVITYDIYQTYVSPIPPVNFSPAEEMSLKMQVALRLEEHRVYDRRCATIKYAFVVGVSVILIPIALVINVIPIDMAWLLQFTGIFFGSAVCPIAFGVSWYRITSWGMMSGSIGGFIAGVASWLIYASTLDGGLVDFRKNTGDVYAMIVGNSVSFGVGLILCIIVSLSVGCCNDDLIEAEEWHKTRSLDNPICSWIDSYMEDMKDEESREIAPSISTIRKTYRGAEICGYFVGVLLAVGILLIWPAFMLLTFIWEQHVWNSWWLVCLIWLCIAAAYCIFLPLVLEVYNICSQREYNRTIKRRHKKEKDYEYYAQVDEHSLISESVGKRSQYVDATATEMNSVTINPAS
ncbi:unnamed protein product [Owenia fusiformis]|uniref:Uncharacterized protein n=1 Tax=Owenia fusiformis TaxID=6347 RepID=A0A8J1XF38_OWEFU|nr:unnamed protein product [Owenia fusiformis]